MSGLFLGSGRLLIACAEHWLSSGRRIPAVASDCPDVSAWAGANHIERIAPSELSDAGLAAGSFDYLFSIVNHAITPPEVLALPSRQAINYHDSPLPRYSGFNATSWAIMEEQPRHAVTWHEMSADVDGGAILLQRFFDIQNDDTAFTLGAKCIEAGLASFRDLVGLLSAAESAGAPIASTPPAARQDFHRRSDRPGVGLIDFRQPAARVCAFVRALDLGPDDNWMCRPKLLLPSGVYIVGEASADPAKGASGEILSVDRASILIAASDGSVRCSRLTTLEGDPVDVMSTGAIPGQRLRVMPEAEQKALDELDAGLTRSERFWVRRLSTLQGPAPAFLHPQPGDADPALIVRKLGRQSTDGSRESVVAAFAACLARVGAEGPFDLALARNANKGLEPFYSDVAPMRFDVDLSDGFPGLVTRVRSEVALQDRHVTYARDMVTRYGVLRAAPTAPLPTIGIRFQPIEGLDPRHSLIAGTHLTIIVADDGRDVAWAYDRRAISEAELSRVVNWTEILLADGLANPPRPVGELEILPSAERDMLLEAWQGEVSPVDAVCIHDLFEAQAARTPDAVAVRFEDKFLTYRDLDRRSNFVARVLKAKGVGPDVLVAVCIERSLDLIVGLLGVLKAGGAYVPLDAAYPRERLGMMIEDSRSALLLTQKHLVERLPDRVASVLCIEDIGADGDPAPIRSGAGPDNLAYVIFTSGSTGRPKGVMIEHRNVANFFVGMDAKLGTTPGVWLAVTSISFDISVLELFWTLTRGFEVVIQGESDRASLARKDTVKVSKEPMAFGLFYFAADQGGAEPSAVYRLLLEGARFADAHGFSAVWTPERHFHAFGGLYPNPAVTTAALATITDRIALRAGSVVLPLHNPLRVAEDWSVIDQLSGGRVGLSFASGWHVNDFAFMPENYERRREIMLESIETVMKLWRGEAVDVRNGQGKTISVSVLPRPVQAAPPIWIASAGSVETFKLAGRLGVNVLTNMLGQDIDDLRNKFAAYRAARREAGHEGQGNISVMLHTFVCESTDRARELARKPFCDYLTSSFDLIKVAPTMFPAFRQPSAQGGQGQGFDASRFTAEDMAALMDHAFERYFETAGLFGSPENAIAIVERLKAIGANEIACLIDFGIDTEVVLESLPHLDRLRQLANQGAETPDEAADYGMAAQIRKHGVTHLQCTPSMARILAGDPDSLSALSGLDYLLLGGEALPADLAEALLPVIGGTILNMYGPTETTIWSTTARVRAGEAITIGRPIANTTVRILDSRNQLAPVGVSGELCLGGAGVVRGYLGRPDLTGQRFVPDPFDEAGRLYRTGDLCRYRESGDIEFLGRLDHQVKVNGYRIELSAIEAILGRHPRVRQSVVLAREETGTPRLVGYVIPTIQASPAGDALERVSQWQALWDETYQQSRAATDARFNIAGWTSSLTGAPIPAEAMREWLDLTERSILAFNPRRILEIGCGVGMVLYRLVDHVEHYTAVDVSAHALAAIRRELGPEERAKVTLMQKPADALEGLADGSFDTVVINSVCQYFPDAGYFVRVLKRASQLVRPGGRIFIGDVRSRDSLDVFHALASLHHTPGHLDAGEFAQRARKRVAQEGELVLSDAFFRALGGEIPRISGVDVRLKAGVADTEMNAFRYDVTLHIEGESSAPIQLPPASKLDTLDAVRSALSKDAPVIVLEDLLNARLATGYAILRAMTAGAGKNVSDFMELLVSARRGVDPGDLVSLDGRYAVDLLPARSGDPERFDAVFRHKITGPGGRLPPAGPEPAMPPSAYANQPTVHEQDNTALFDDLRAHLREFLPDYMTPSAFVEMESFPLTPNGKIDRKNFPPPGRAASNASADHVAPTNALEQTIADIWKALLNLERVGVRDNIFDLGANSLLTAQANQRLSEALGRKVSLVSMFRFPTIETLAAHLGEGKAAPDGDAAQARKQADRKKDAAARRRELRGGASGL